MSKYLDIFNTSIISNLKTLYYGAELQTFKIILKNQTINYVKIGSGNHTLFLNPGCLGTIWQTYDNLIRRLDKNLFTIYAWDPPGLGESRPPNRVASIDFYESDTNMAYELISYLKLEDFSVLGWQDGGVIAVNLAANYPELKVKKLVIWGTIYFIDEDTKNRLVLFKCACNWTYKVFAPLIDTYGQYYFKDIFIAHMRMLEHMYRQRGDICATNLTKIKCPTLVLKSEYDPFAHTQPAYVLAYVQNSLIRTFPKKREDFHLVDKKKFHAVVSNFLLSERKSDIIGFNRSRKK